MMNQYSMQYGQYAPRPERLSETSFTLLTKIMVIFNTIVSGLVLPLNIMLIITSFDSGFNSSAMMIVMVVLVKCTTIFFLYYFLFSSTTSAELPKYVFLTGEIVMAMAFWYLVYQLMMSTNNIASVLTNPFVIDFGFLCATTGLALIISMTSRVAEQYYYYPAAMTQMEVETPKKTVMPMAYGFYPSN